MDIDTSNLWPEDEVVAGKAETEREAKARLQGRKTQNWRPKAGIGIGGTKPDQIINKQFKAASHCETSSFVVLVSDRYT